MPEPFLPKPFTCDVERRDGTARLRPAGDLDLSTVPILEAHLREALDDGTRRLVVDLRALSFMDSTGLRLVTRWNLESQRDGFAFALVPGDERVQRLFDLTGMGGYFTFLDG